MLVWAVFLGCSDASTQTAPPARKVAVNVVSVVQEPKTRVIYLLGTVEANRQMKIAFKIGGKIKAIHFEEGQMVKKGTLLAGLDTTELLARRAKAQENKNKAGRDLRRMEKLYRKASIAKAKYQDSRSLYIAAQAELQIIEDQLKNSRILAPFVGRISKKYAEQGEIVSAGTPLALLTEMDPILVKVAIPDNFIGKLQTGRPAHIRVGSYPNRLFAGVTHYLETSADPLTRTFGMEIRLANPEEKLRPGQIANVEVYLCRQDDGVFIPLDAVIGFGADPAVFVVKAHKAERRRIQTGAVIGQAVEVLSGLLAGDQLVVSGQEYLKDRQPVIITEKLAGLR
jgi:membrane fusion protein (multidrug efflux system)